MCDSSKTPCGSTNSLRGRIETERGDEPLAAGHRLGTHATADHPGQGTQRPLRAALAATLERTESVLETRSAEELHLPWQDERRAALGCDDPANLQDGSRSSSYQEAGYATYPEAFFRDWTIGSRGRSHGYQQAARTLELYNHHDLFTLPARTSRLDAQPDRLASGSAMPQMDRSFPTVTIGTVAEETIREAAAGQELVAAPEATPRQAIPALTVHSLIKRFTPAFIAKYRESIAAQVESTLARIDFCRTAPMGGRTFTCTTCES